MDKILQIMQFTFVSVSLSRISKVHRSRIQQEAQLSLKELALRIISAGSSSYLRQSESYAIRWVCQSFSLSFCAQHYYRSNQPISFKLDVMIDTTNGKKWLTFGVLVVIRSRIPDHIFHYAHNCGIQRFISFSHTAVTGRFSQHSAKCLTQTR